MKKAAMVGGGMVGSWGLLASPSQESGDNGWGAGCLTDARLKTRHKVVGGGRVWRTARLQAAGRGDLGLMVDGRVGASGPAGLSRTAAAAGSAELQGLGEAALLTLHTTCSPGLDNAPSHLTGSPSLVPRAISNAVFRGMSDRPRTPASPSESR
jgi:hypothetical protein